MRPERLFWRVFVYVLDVDLRATCKEPRFAALLGYLQPVRLVDTCGVAKGAILLSGLGQINGLQDVPAAIFLKFEFLGHRALALFQTGFISGLGIVWMHCHVCMLVLIVFQVGGAFGPLERICWRKILFRSRFSDAALI